MLEIALIYLAAAIVAVPIAKRVGLGSVLGYLIAGILIGPYALGVVGDQTDVMHFAEFGVVMMLFLVGLELCDPNKSLPDEIERDALAAASAVRSALLSRSARSASACCVYVMSKSSRVEELILL